MNEDDFVYDAVDFRILLLAGCVVIYSRGYDGVWFSLFLSWV